MSDEKLKGWKQVPVDYSPIRGGKFSVSVATTAAQREIIASLKLEPSSSLAFNEVLSLRLDGALDEDCLRRAIAHLSAQHEMLRAVISGDGLSLLIREHADSNLRFTAVGTENELAEIEAREVATLFDIVNGPGVRWHLVRLAEERHRLLFSVHHVFLDGWSISLVLSELSTIYTRLRNRLPLVEKKRDSFVAYAATASSAVPAYWLEKFRTPVETLVLSQRPRSLERTYTSQRLDLSLTSSQVEHVKRASRTYGASTYTVLMSAFTWLLSQRGQARDFAVGMAVAGQSHLERPELIGHAVNMLPLRVQVGTAASFKEHTAKIRTNMLDAFEHADVTFGELIKKLSVPREGSGIPLFQVVFNIDQQAKGQGLEFAGLTASYTTVPRVCENFEIFLNVVSCEDRLALECQFNTDVYARSDISELLAEYLRLLDRVDLMAQEQFTASSSQQALPKTAVAQVTASPEKVKAICDVWQAVLGVPVGAEDNFFARGGHSLLAIEAARQLSQRLERPVPAKHVFSHPTPRQLAGLLETLAPNHQPPAAQREARSNAVLSPSQWQAWYLEEVAPGTTMHNLPAAIRLNGELDHALLRRTFSMLVERHPALRTKISSGMPPEQIVLPTTALSQVELAVEKIVETEISDRLAREARHVFHKGTAPLFCAKLFQIHPQQHVLFFMVHHIVWDGWSFDIFFEELDLIYRALKKGETPVLSPQTMSALDHAIDMRSFERAGAGENSKAYWRARLALPLPTITWPATKPRPTTMTHAGATLPFQFSALETERLRAFARQQGTTLFNVLLTAHVRLIAKVTELTDVVVGIPVRCRDQLESQNVIGFFVNTMAIRVSVGPQDSFVLTLQKVAQAVQEGMEHQLLPFQIVLSELKVPRDLSRTPVFQTFFSFQDVTNRSGQFDGASYSQINVDKASTHTDLDVWVKASAQRIEGAFEYRPDLFYPAQVTNYLAELKNIVSATVKTEALGPIELIAQQAQLFPSKIAVSDARDTVSYGELWRRVESCAVALQNQGAKPGVLVGVSLSRGISMLTALLAILRTGAGYVPLDPNFPRLRLRSMLDEATPLFTITDHPESELFLQEKVFTMAQLAASGTFRAVTKSPADPMYVIFTSGSTGKPKGVEVSYGAVENFLASMQLTPGLGAEDCLLAVTTLSFDIAVLELYLPLMSGAKLVMADAAQAMDGVELAQLMRLHQVTVMQATPATWRLLLASGWAGKADLRILCGGEALSTDLAETLCSRVKEVWNMYGPTETTVWSSCQRIVPQQKITIGKPIAATQFYALDEQLRPVSVGEIGELYIGGQGLATGYYRRPDLTQERFITHALGRLYRTGDLVRELPTGEWECLGRIDQQVKIRGYRIELEEIEAQLRKCPGVEAAVVTCQEFAAGDTRLVAHVVGQLDFTALGLALKQTLPSYMVPAHFKTIPGLPLTANGKIDRKALAPFIPAEAPSSKSTDLAQIWQHTLGLAQVNDGDDFFEMGGNSLLAVTLITEINNAFSLNLGLASLIQHPKFADFKKLTQPQALLVTNLRSLVPIKSGGSKAPLFCFHGVGGNVMNYVALVPAVDGKRPLYGVQSRGLDGKEPFVDSIEEMARFYTEEIRQVQPHGPYLLAGGSMGGTVAFEVAQQLLALGESIENIIMFDTFGPDVEIKIPDPVESSFFRRLKAGLFHRLKVLSIVVRKALLNVNVQKVPLDIILFELEQANYRTLRQYQPKPYAGSICIIRAKLQDKGWYSDPFMGWRKVVKGDIVTHEIEGTHYDFIERPELVRVLSRLL